MSFGDPPPIAARILETVGRNPCSRIASAAAVTRSCNVRPSRVTQREIGRGFGRKRTTFHPEIISEVLLYSCTIRLIIGVRHRDHGSAMGACMAFEVPSSSAPSPPTGSGTPASELGSRADSLGRISGARCLGQRSLALVRCQHPVGAARGLATVVHRSDTGTAMLACQHRRRRGFHAGLLASDPD